MGDGDVIGESFKVRFCRIKTHWGTMVFFDPITNKLRHGPEASCPRNVMIAANDSTGCLFRSDMVADHTSPLVVPKEEVLGRALTPDGSLGAFQTFHLLVDRDRFGLWSAGLFLCAERDGLITWSRKVLGAWESFQLIEDDNDPLTSRERAIMTLATAKGPGPGPDQGNFRSSENADLMMRFCSLGANCEFGIAQRQCGAEPIDLLRWSSTNSSALLQLLDQRFVGVGDVTISVPTQPRAEYMVNSVSYHGWGWHSFVYEGDMPPERVQEREAKRMPRLAEFLMENLTDAHRIFVRTAAPGETSADWPKIAAAVRQYGLGQVLFVERDPARTGLVHRITNGAMVGYIDEFADPANVHVTTQVGSWLSICRNALALSA
jgi:hypothetical protein